MDKRRWNEYSDKPIFVQVEDGERFNDAPYRERTDIDEEIEVSIKCHERRFSTIRDEFTRKEYLRLLRILEKNVPLTIEESGAYRVSQKANDDAASPVIYSDVIERCHEKMMALEEEELDSCLNSDFYMKELCEHIAYTHKRPDVLREPKSVGFYEVAEIVYCLSKLGYTAVCRKGDDTLTCYSQWNGEELASDIPCGDSEYNLKKLPVNRISIEDAIFILGKTYRKERRIFNSGVGDYAMLVSHLSQYTEDVTYDDTCFSFQSLNGKRVYLNTKEALKLHEKAMKHKDFFFQVVENPLMYEKWCTSNWKYNLDSETLEVVESLS